MQTTVSLERLLETKLLISSKLNDYCATRINDATTVGKGYATLWKAISELVAVGGKRFRPYMLLLSYQAFAPNETIDRVLPAALSQELLHLAMLIHDDIIDRDTIRYGIKNITGMYGDFYEPIISDAAERLHMAQSSSILAGDALLSEAYALLSETEVDAAKLRAATKLFSEAVFEVVGGELLDTESAFINDAFVTATTIARYKTASYSFMSPLLIGATLAGTSEHDMHNLRKFAELIGIGYQLRDDLLGVFGDPTKTGKSVDGDIVEGKQTFLIEQFYQLATEAQKKEFMTIFHNASASSEDIDRARQLLTKSGARKAVENKVASMADDAGAIVDTLAISATSKDEFYNLITLCLDRKA